MLRLIHFCTCCNTYIVVFLYFVVALCFVFLLSYCSVVCLFVGDTPIGFVAFFMHLTLVYFYIAGEQLPYLELE